MSYGGTKTRGIIPCGNCWIAVPQDELAVYEQCGSYKGNLQPGCSWAGIDCCQMCLSTRAVSMRINEQVTRCDTKTKDNVFVRIDCAVQCQPRPDRIRDAIYKLRNPVQQIDSFVGDVVRAHVPKMDLDEVFSNKDSIADAVSEKLTERMREFGYSILQALVVNVEPDGKVKASMNAMETARRMRVASETKANADHFVVVKKAEADAESKALQGQGIARQRAAICQGLKDSIGAGEGSIDPDRISELLLVTQYFDALEKMADQKGTKIFIPHSIGALEDVANQIARGVLSKPAGKGGGAIGF